MADTSREKGRRAGNAVAVVINALLLAAANAYAVWIPWTRGVVTDAFVDVLWAVNLGLWVQIVGNALMVVSQATWLRRLCDFGFALVAVIGAVAFWRVFPFDFTRIGLPWLALVVRVTLVVGVIGGVVGMLVALARVSRGGGHPPAHAARP